MFKRAFIAVAIVFASPAIVSAQDIFWSFSPTTLECTSVEFCLGLARYIFSLMVSLVLTPSISISQSAVQVRLVLPAEKHLTIFSLSLVGQLLIRPR